MSGLTFLDRHPFVRIHAAQKARGVILGGALGDALGLYTEFLPGDEAKRSYPEPIEPGKTTMRGDSHRDKFNAGDWTDDTDHALLLILSVLHHYGQHGRLASNPDFAQDFAVRLNIWCEQGLLALNKPPLGIGQTIATVALNPSFLANPRALAREKWLRVELGEKPASNGSLMRTHPLGVLAAGLDSDDEAYRLAADISTTTHGDPRCTLSCCVVVGVLRGIIRGEILNEDDLDAALTRALEWIKSKPELLESDHMPSDNSDPFRWLNLAEFEHYTGRTTTLSALQLDESRKIGYIYKCLGAGIITLRSAMRDTPCSDTFAKHMRALIMEGGDADTNGAVAGGLLGAWLGDTQLPPDWLKDMNDSEWLKTKAARFVAAAGLGDEADRKSWEEVPQDKDADVHGGRTLLTKEELDAREKSMVFAVVAKSHARNQAAEKEKKGGQKSWSLFK